MARIQKSGAGFKRNYRRKIPVYLLKSGKAVPRKVTTAQAIRTIVKSSSETKYITRQVEKDVVHNSAIGPADIYKVFPEISQGTSELQRDGDKISPQSLVIKGLLGLDRNYLTSNRPIQVRVMCVGLKAAKFYPLAQTAWTGGAYLNLLKVNDEAGAIQNKQYVGDTLDNTYPINKDSFIVYGQRKITLYPQQNVGEGNTSIESGNLITKSFSMKIKTPASIWYDNSASNTPQNFAPFFLVGYQYLDGTGPDVVATKVIMNATSHLYFKDM